MRKYTGNNDSCVEKVRFKMITQFQVKSLNNSYVRKVRLK